MSWVSGELILAVTGVLFAVVAALGTMPSAALATSMRLLYLSIGVMSVGAAFVLSSIEGMAYPPALWVLPLVPCIIGAVMISDSHRHTHHDNLPADPTTETLACGMPAITKNAESAAHPTVSTDADVALVAADPAAAPSELARIAFACPHLRAAVAANPATPANLLEWLAAVGDEAVVASIARRA
ncbi:hypothetical protein [Demequina flava]|uniref:variant leucine-rich repeat-containing protein n=1 Tax=Demequina flava TaxID=1095025 RepID=UPI0007810C35|nr:hypothetical protein [Demequina flava]